VLFSVSADKIKNSYMLYVIFQFLQHSVLRVFSTVSATCNNRP